MAFEAGDLEPYYRCYTRELTEILAMGKGLNNISIPSGSFSLDTRVVMPVVCVRMSYIHRRPIKPFYQLSDKKGCGTH
jgi:hypothetical protein